ncbi:MAG: DivIVA domain-containing protein [Gleimia sp.]|jgi:DivIVA domain-containing protein
MALLTTEDVLNKTFQSVKFREGYDQVEVDEFLDEVVETIYALQVENTELKQKLEVAENRVEELEAGAPQQAAAPVEPEPKPEPQPTSAPEDATSMLALAQRVHDEYVRDGREEGDRIIAEARQEGEAIVKQAQDKHNSILHQLEEERGLLKTKINELKNFESDYRGRLREHLQSLLGQVSDN